jgi:hypothetical protein
LKGYPSGAPEEGPLRHGAGQALTTLLMSLAHVVSVFGLVLFWFPKTGFGPQMRASLLFSEGERLKAAG